MKKFLLTFLTILSYGILSSQCNYVVNMQDSYGDGWNGASISVSVNGIANSANWSIANGSSYTDFISTYSGDIIEFSFNSGAYDSEITFQIIDPAGNQIYNWNGNTGLFLTHQSNSTCSPPNCVVPNTLSINNITQSSADISWLAGGSEIKWIFNENLVNSTSQSMTGLSSATQYDVSIKAVCGINDTSDALTGSFTTTGSCGNYTLNLSDSWGDGWNGNGIVLSINNAVRDTFTISSSSSSASYSIAVNIGDILDFDYVVDVFNTGTNTYPSENSYSILDESNSNVGTGTHNGGDLNDVLAITACPACSAPTSLSASNITNDSAQISWIPGDNETQWLFNGNVVNDTNQFMSGLNGTTTYNVSVQAICGVGDSSDTETISFTTLQTPGTCGFFTINLSDNYGDGWNGNALVLSINNNITDTFTIVNGYSASYQVPVDIGDLIDVNYIADINSTGSNTYPDENSYEVRDADNNIAGSGNYSNGDVNDLSGLVACPSCSFPTGTDANNITISSADMSWTAGGTETSWNVEYGISGFVQGSGSLSTTNSTSLSLTGLSSSTFYDFYVQADCGSATSTWTGPFTFATPFNPPSGINCSSGGNIAIIFSEEFDNNNAGWTGNIGNSNGNWEIPNNATSSNTGADAAHSGSSYMNYEASNTSPNTGNIVSPAIDLSTAQSQAELSFWMHAFGSSMGTLDVGIGTSASGPFSSVFTWTGQYQQSGSDVWQNIGVDLTSYIGQTIYIQLSQIDSVSGFTGDMSIDLFQISTCQSCLDPSALSATNVTSNSADVSWSPGGSESEWLFNGNVVNSNNQTLTGLNGATTYDVIVQAICGAGDSSALQTLSFSTEGSCGSYGVNLSDSWGDGWNGNGLIVSINGNITDTLTISTGSTSSFSIPVNVGDVIDFDYVNDVYSTGVNTYPGENSYTIFNPDNNLVGSGTYDNSTGDVNDVLAVTACPSWAVIPDDNFEAYLEANGMGDGIPNNDTVSIANIANVKKLDVSNQNIADLSGISYFTELIILVCENNSLTSLDITQNSNLEKLNCRYNQISNLDLSQNTALTTLNLSDNNFSTINVSQNTALEQLSCEDNLLSTLDVSNNTSLKYFICGDNQLTNLNVSANTALTYLGCHANQLTSLDVSNNIALEVLSFGKNQLSTLDVSNNTAINEIRCYENQLIYLDLSANTNLTKIDISYNPLTCLNLKNGFNTNIVDFNAKQNTNLNCIEVDNPSWSTSNWINVDSNLSFSTNCSYPAGCF